MNLAILVGLLVLVPTPAANAAGESASFVSDARTWIAAFTGSRNGDWYLVRNLSGFRAYPLLDRAQRRMNHGEYNLAREAVDRALRVAPRNAAAWTISGDLEYRRAHMETAWHHLNYALSLDPTFAQALLYRAYVRIEYGDFDGAVADLDAAVASGRLTEDQLILAENGLIAIRDQLRQLNSVEQRRGTLPITVALLRADPNRRPVLPRPEVVAASSPSSTQSWTYTPPDIPAGPSAGDRAFDLASAGQCAVANPLFVQAFRETGDATYLIGRADCFNSHGNAAAAQSAFEDILLQGSALSVANEVYVLESLGYLYESAGDYDQAADAWRGALELDQSSAYRLALARSLMASGQTMEAARTISEMNPDTLPVEEQAAFYDLRGGLRAQTDPVGAIPDLEAAARAGETADRRFSLAIALQEAGRHEEALQELLRAKELDPESADLTLALAYAYGNLDRPAASIPYFVEGLRQDDERFFEAREDLAYAQLRTRRYDAASHSFRQVVDNRPRYAQDTRAERRDLDERIYRVRSEIRELERTWYADGAVVYRSADINGSGLPGADRDQSQWSAQLGWYPLRGRIATARNLSIFARAYQSFEPGSFNLRDESLQASVGLRIRPFNGFGLTLAGERLIAVGDESRNAWQFSAAHGWGVGGDWHPVDRNWFVASSYLEAAYIPDDPQFVSAFGEVSVGQAFAIAPRLAVIPHVVASARFSEDEFATNFLSELGIGASLKYWFDDTRYQAPRGSAEFELEYRWFAYDDTAVPLDEDGALVGRITITR